METILVCRHNDVTLTDVNFAVLQAMKILISLCPAFISRYGLKCFYVYKPYIEYIRYACR